MTLPRMMFALVQRHDGYSGRAEGPRIDDIADWLEAAEVPVPQPGPGQVLVRLRMASVNPSDLHFIKGEYGQPRVKGAPAGFEGVGDVVAAGSGAEKLMGQRVAFVVAMGGSGAWADYALTNAANCIPCRPELRDEDAAGQIVNPLTAIAMFDLVKASGTHSFVLTAGASQLSKLLIALGRDAGIAPIAVVRRASVAPTLRALGAAEVLDAGDPQALTQFAAISRRLKPRVMLDAVGNQFSADLFMTMPNRAQWVVYGKLDATPPTLREMGQFVFAGKAIRGFWLSEWLRETPPDRQAAAVAEVQQRFVSSQWVTDVAARVPLRRVMVDLTAALRQTDGKVLITA